MQTRLTIETHGPGLYEFTDQVRTACAGISEGLATVFVQHTSCGLLIQENADPDVQSDLEGFFRRLVPDADDASMRWLRHTLEGPDDMPAHIKAALVPVSLQVPIAGGRPLLGTWQGIYLWEFRHAPHRRRVVIHVST
ncbi:secondary thiamine-phosphate synthase enzyme YjbQ [Halovulum sp. GXIMD14794]